MAQRGATQEVKCACCKQPFMARVADIKRGWGKFCSKSCKATKQEARTADISAYRHRAERPRRAFDPEATEHPFSDYALGQD